MMLKHLWYLMDDSRIVAHYAGEVVVALAPDEDARTGEDLEAWSAGAVSAFVMYVADDDGAVRALPHVPATDEADVRYEPPGPAYEVTLE